MLKLKHFCAFKIHVLYKGFQESHNAYDYVQSYILDLYQCDNAI